MPISRNIWECAYLCVTIQFYVQIPHNNWNEFFFPKIDFITLQRIDKTHNTFGYFTYRSYLTLKSVHLETIETHNLVETTIRIRTNQQQQQQHE